MASSCCQTASTEAGGGALVYTCPMHPEIHQERPGRCPKCGMALEPAGAVSMSPVPRNSRLPRIPWAIGACVFLAIAAFFLWQEHRAHLLGALPYILLLVCPLMHLFMHRGHHHHSDSNAGTHRHGAES
ncbi:MAG TPA: DUF2933 domain-containing protein [Polyangiaceae bacterium]|nr:DUF2933 domain-containing protein [Polyangiaceae bacterium]